MQLEQLEGEFLPGRRQRNDVCAAVAVASTSRDEPAALELGHDGHHVRALDVELLAEVRLRDAGVLVDDAERRQRDRPDGEGPKNGRKTLLLHAVRAPQV